VSNTVKASEPQPLAFKATDPRSHACPHDNYVAMQGQSPVFFDPDRNLYWVTRYDLIEKINQTPETFSNHVDIYEGTRLDGYPQEVKEIRSGLVEHVDTMLTNANAESHRAYRKLVDKAFMPRRVRMIESEIDALAVQLMDDFPETNEVEFASQFAIPLTFTIIARQLGISTDMLPTFKKWSDSIDTLISNMGDTEALLASARNERDMQNYMLERCAARREDPKDDIISDIVTADFNGERPLNDGELYNILTQLFVAGNKSTRSTLIGAIYNLAQNPEILESIRAGGRPAVKAFVEEILRLWAPVQGLYRRVLHDTEIEGVAIPKGALVHVRYAAANIDPAVHENPLEIDLERPNPKRHMAYGSGAHHCIAATLARQELVSAIEQLTARYSRITLEQDEKDLDYFPSYHLRCPTALHVKFHV